MKNFWINFLKRGCMWAWSGPVILCIVWACLKKGGAIETLEVDAGILAVVSTIVIAFAAAGISVVYQLEQLPKGIAALIQMSVLYIVYLTTYLLNGWMPGRAIGIFTVIFFVCFGIIWAIIYLSTRNSVNQLNAQFKNKE